MIAELIERKIALPQNYSVTQICSFYGRDKSRIAEHVASSKVRKGTVFHAIPAEIELEFNDKAVNVTLRLSKHKSDITMSEIDILSFINKILGLDQNIDDFQSAVIDQPKISALIAVNPGLRIPICITPFEALSWAITGQQISVPAALSIRRKLIEKCNIQSPSELLCYPTWKDVGNLSLEELKNLGYSTSKATTLKTVTRLIAENQLNLDIDKNKEDIDRLASSLSSIRGIGPWTVNYTLLRGYAWADCSLHGDAAIKRAIKNLLNIDDSMSNEFAEDWLQQFSPWRSFIAIHLWQSLNTIPTENK